MPKSPLKVGLDLDGVILYNPARIVRPMVVAAKKLLLKKRVSTFYIPKSAAEKYMWYLFHKSSIFVAPGFEDFKQMAKEGKVKLYIVSARYSFLWSDLQKWLDKIDAKSFVESCFYNMYDEQPPIFKEKTIRQLGLDMFVEDNWDVVKYLSPRLKKTTVYWIYNILDNRISYPHKYPTLKAVAKSLQL